MVRKYIRPQNCALSDIFGSDLTRRVLGFFMGIVICHRQKFGQVWGSLAPLPEVAASQENSAARRHPFRPSTTTWKNRSHSAM